VQVNQALGEHRVAHWLMAQALHPVPQHRVSYLVPDPHRKLTVTLDSMEQAGEHIVLLSVTTQLADDLGQGIEHVADLATAGSAAK